MIQLDNNKGGKMSIRALALTAGIFGAFTMFFLAWWLILTGNADGPPTLMAHLHCLKEFI